MLNDDDALPERCSECNALLFSRDAQWYGRCHDCREEAKEEEPLDLEDQLDAAPSRIGALDSGLQCKIATNRLTNRKF